MPMLLTMAAFIWRSRSCWSICCCCIYFAATICRSCGLKLWNCSLDIPRALSMAYTSMGGRCWAPWTAFMAGTRRDSTCARQRRRASTVRGIGWAEGGDSARKTSHRQRRSGRENRESRKLNKGSANRPVTSPIAENQQVTSQLYPPSKPLPNTSHDFFRIHTSSAAANLHINPSAKDQSSAVQSWIGPCFDATSSAPTIPAGRLNCLRLCLHNA